MATEVYSDLNIIQDEDVLRRMWADTEDFSRKKEIRARMYKIREQRLRDFYTTGDVSEIANKHQRTTHADSLGDQGFMRMKSKEIRDSESPTRDIQRKGNGYWDTRQETVYGSGKEDDKNVEIKYVDLEARGVIKEGDTQTNMAYATRTSKEKAWKEDDDGYLKSEALNKVSQSASVSKSDTGEQRTMSKNEEYSKKSEQKTSSSMVSSYSTSSSTSSSKKITSSYQTSSQDQYIDESKPRAIDYDITSDFKDINDMKNYKNESQKQTFSTSQIQENVQDVQNIKNIQNVQNIQSTKERTKTDIQNEEITNFKLYRDTVDNSTRRDSTYRDTVDTSTRRDSTQRDTVDTSTKKDSTYRDTVDTSTKRDSTHRDTVDTSTRRDTVDTSTRKDSMHRDTVDSSTKRDSTYIDTVDTTIRDSTHDTRKFINQEKDTVVKETKNEKATEQKILNEIHKLDTYLSTHTPTPSTPVSPHAEPDGGWKLVSDKNGEFVYHEKNPDVKEYTTQPREVPVKHPSSLDLPTCATDGQYMTTYQQSYTKISVDHSPSHEFFAKTLRSSPERSSPSPSKRDSAHSSSNRSSPERKKTNSRSSLERSSPEHKKRIETKSPVDKKRSSPSKSPTQKRKPSIPETTTTFRKNSETKTKETKSKRKFSSTKEKAANRNRVATPGASPSTSPVNKKTIKDTSDSDSDVSQATYNKYETKTETKTTYKKKEQSPEYSSEGSITRELQKKKESSPERSAFAPIKKFRTSPEKDKIDELTVENVREHTNSEKRTDQLVEIDEEDNVYQATDKTYSVDINVKECREETKPETTTIIQEIQEDIARSVNSSPTKADKYATVTETFVIEEKLQNEKNQEKKTPKKESTPRKVEKSPSPERKTERSPSPTKRPVDKSEKHTTETFVVEERLQNVSQNIQDRKTPKKEHVAPSRKVGKSPERSVSPTKRPVDTPKKITERRGSTEKTVKTTTVTKRTFSSELPKQVKSVPRESSFTRKQTVSTTVTERKPVQKTIKPKTETPRTPVKKTPETTPIRRIPTRTPEKKTPVSPAKPKTPIKKEISPPSKVTRSTVSVTARLTAKKEDTKPLRRRPSAEDKKPETILKKPSPKLKTPEIKKPEKTYNAPKKPSTLQNKPKTPAETKKQETKNFLKSETDDVCDLEDEMPPDEFYVDMDDETDFVEKTPKTESFTKPKPEQYRTLKADNDFLNVIVQHPKSSRESSPGYPSTADNFIVTTSEDGESNPRYADFVSEPEDVEIFDKLTGPSGPIEYNKPKPDTQEDEEIPKSVAEKVSVFLNEAKKSLETRTTTNQVLIDSHSVSKNKTLFENVAKEPEKPKELEILKTPLFSRDEPDNYRPKEITETNDEYDEFISKNTQDIKEVPKTQRKDTPVPKPPGKTFLRDDDKKVEKIETVTNIDVNTKKSFFEKKAQEQAKPKPETGSYMKSTIASNVRAVSPDKPYNEERRKSSLASEETPVLERKPSKTEVKTQKTELISKFERKTSTDKYSKSPERETPTERKPSSEAKIQKAELISKFERKNSDKFSRKSPERGTPFERKPSQKAEIISKFERKVSSDKYTSRKSPERGTPYERKPSTEFKRTEVTSKFERKDSTDKYSRSPERGTPYERKPSTEFKRTEVTSKFERKDSTDKYSRSPERGTPYERKPSTEFKRTEITSKFERKDSSKQERSPSPKKSPERPISPNKYDTRNDRTERAKSPQKYPETRKDKPERATSPSKQVEKPIRSSSPPKQYEKTTDRPKSPEKKDSRRSSKTDEIKLTKPVNMSESTLFKQTESNFAKTKTEEKFGVQLRKTPSATKFEMTQPRKSLTNEIPEIEKIFDLELLEQLLIKAEAYEERRSIRAQIRLVKKELEEKHNNVSKTTRTQRTFVTNDVAPKNRGINGTEVKKTVVKTTYTTNIDEKTSRKSSPERKTYLPDKNINLTKTTVTDKTSFKRTSPERTVKPSEIKSKQESYSTVRKSSTDSTTEKSSTVRKTTSTFERKTTTDKTVSGTDSITSSYGMGPIDENGRPLFGLRALKRANAEPETTTTEHKAETVTTYTTSTRTFTTEHNAPASLASLKSMSQIGRRYSGPQIVELADDETTNVYESTKRSSRDYTVEEVDSKEKRLSSELKEDNIKAFTSHMKMREDQEDKKPLIRGDSVKALQHKFQQATAAANQPSGGSSYPKAGLILRSNSLLQSDDQNQFSSSMKKTKVVVQDSYETGGHKQTVVKAQMSEKIEDSNGLNAAREVQGVRAVQTTLTRDGPVEKSTTAMRVTTSDGGSTSTTSFLDNNSKVTGVQDILSRMRNADLVTETGDTEEDAQARALLNKFLGASVILQGMEQGMKNSGINQPRSATLVGEADKLVKASIRTREENYEDITDETQLKNLLEACTDLEDRRKLRARLREVMAEEKGGVGEPNGSLSGIDITGIWPKGANVDDSGTESGEDLRLINPEVMHEVQTALSRLEGVIPGLDPNKRSAVTQLVSSLQSCLKINKETPPTPPPRRFGNKRLLKNRHTVGVTREELVEARKWADETGLNRKPSTGDISTNLPAFRPVRFIPPPKLEEKSYTQLPILRTVYQKPILHKIGVFMEPGPQNGILSYNEPESHPYERCLSDSGSLSDYDPSLNLFTPEQSVQIAVHKAAINKQIKVQRGSSEDGDISSADEDKQELSTVQRLLQLASDDKKPKYTPKKQKIKRANTIDIPKTSMFDYSSDDYGVSADESNRKGSDDMGHLGNARPPSFEPKTENDHKFLSFLKRVSETENSKVTSYNPSARGGKHWQNRFSSIKTAFEPKDLTPKHTFSPSPAKLFWQKSEIKQKENKLPWSVKTQENGVIVGSLTVAKPMINNFNHAPKSAFKPIEKKPITPLISPASGSVKQIAALKFSSIENATKPKPKAPIKPIFNTQNDKKIETHKFYNIPTNDVKKIQEKPKYTPINQDKKYIYSQNLNQSQIQPSYYPSKPVYQPLSQKFNPINNDQPKIKTDLSYTGYKKETFPSSNHLYDYANESKGKVSNAYVNHIDEAKNQYTKEPKEDKNFRVNFEEKNVKFVIPPYSHKIQDNYESKAKDSQYLVNLRDASTIDTRSEYVSNIPSTRTVFRDGQYVSITPKSRTPTIDAESMKEYKSPNHSGGRSPNNQPSPIPNGTYYNNTRLPSKMDDMSHIENYLNVKLNPESPRNSLHISPSIKVEQRDANGDFCEERAVTRVMGQAQCQSAVTVNNRTRTRYDDAKNIQAELRLQVQQSAKQKSLSPIIFPNVLQKSESWHQMVKEQMNKAKQAPPLPRISKAKSSHSLALPRQFESAVSPETVESKKMTVSQYLSKQQNREKRKSVNMTKSHVDDDLDNVDEVFESIFREASKKRNSK